jgi:hypothetical protein
MTVFIRTATYGPVNLGKKISTESDSFMNAILGEIQREGCKIRDVKIVPAPSTPTSLYYTYLITYES